ncbi:hypothetical protein M9H77_34139 [Catharanthus roseus]|uniref:Uncharacterized protein n=1 Tax=Catharanthus roseus TaxID=4058 RepID=A0ACB9ZM21_CATRO|nr:hypothetical protein M9H77_34139 [Catharanthus roseus]
MFVTGNENLQDTDTGSLLDSSQAWVLDFKKNYQKQKTEKLKYCSYNNEQDNNQEKEHNRFRNGRCNRMRQIYEIINSEQKQRSLSSTTSSNNRKPVMNREQLTVNNREKRLDLYLEILQISDRAPTAAPNELCEFGLRVCNEGQPWSVLPVKNRVNPSANRWPQNGALKLSLSKSTRSSHAVTRRVNRHRPANESPEGSHRKTNRLAVRKKRGRQKVRGQEEAAAAQHK